MSDPPLTDDEADGLGLGNDPALLINVLGEIEPSKPSKPAKVDWGPGAPKNGEATRETRTYTPQSIALRLARFWPKGIACDPCSGPDSLISADRRSWPEKRSDPDGLAYTWPPRTYVNPPYCDLKIWLGRWAASQECILLGPVRSRRVWFRAAHKGASAIVDLDPLAFLGHESTFPGDLRLSYRGDEPHRFARIFGDLGSAHIGGLYNIEQPQGDLFA